MNKTTEVLVTILNDCAKGLIVLACVAMPCLTIAYAYHEVYAPTTPFMTMPKDPR